MAQGEVIDGGPEIKIAISKAEEDAVWYDRTSEVCNRDSCA